MLILMPNVALRSVLLQKVPDAIVLEGLSALEPFGLGIGAIEAMPELVAWSPRHNCLFFVESLSVFDEQRLRAVRLWSHLTKAQRVFVSLLASRSAFALHMGSIAYGTHVWFINEPDRSVFLSDSPEASARYREVQIADKRC
jgi:hypothetical protein